MKKKQSQVQPRVNKTKEQLLHELKSNSKFQEKMKFTREVFYPALTRATTSIDDAVGNLTIINSMVMEKFLGFMKETKFKDLKITDSLSPTDPKYQYLKDMLELFDEYNVFDAKDLMEGMKNEIQLFLHEENKSRTLADLKQVWLDQM